jgi:small GTP-binding protein
MAFDSMAAFEGIPRDARPPVKVILVGNSGVGKTCLIAAFQKQGFNRRCEPTVAPSFVCRQLQRTDGSRAVLQIWDTAGQERFSSISQLFFRDAEVALICFDPSEPGSVAGTADWVRRVQAEAPDCRLFGVMTKADRHRTPENATSALAEATAEMATIPVDKWFVTSAVTGQGIDDLFLAAADEKFNRFEVQVGPAPVAKMRRCC